MRHEEQSGRRRLYSQGRIVYSLHHKLDNCSTVIVWLDRSGNSISPLKPAEPGELMVTVTSGDWITKGDDRRQVTSLEVYRSLPLSVS